MDPIYLAMVHHQLLQLTHLSNPDPAVEDVAALAERYLELKQQLQVLDSEFTHVETRLKTAMQTQNLSEINDLKLLQSNRKTVKVDFSQLVKVTQEHGLGLDFPIALTQKLQKQLGEIIAQLSLQVETSTSWRLQKQQDEAADDSQSSHTDF
jgi:ribonuclease D